MDELEKDHQWAESLHAEVDRLGEQYLNSGILPESDAAQFLKAIDELSAMYKRRIRVEDESLFPVAAKVLSNEDKLKIAKEMAARRGK